MYTVGQVPEMVSDPSCATVGVPHASEAVGTGQDGTAGQSMVALPAQMIAGAVISLTVIVALQVAMLPQSSVALQVRV